MMTTTLIASLLFALLGLLAGGIINVLSDDLPQRLRPSTPRCYHCDQPHAPTRWLALLRLLQDGGNCAHCGKRLRRREWLVEGATAVLFALLPWLIADPVVLAVNTFHIALLILIIVIDLENRLILDVVTLPGTAVALAASLIVPSAENTIGLAVVGALAGFIVFFIFYWIGQLVFGPGALGFGDVKLAMLLGAMLGFHRIFFALILGILLGGVISGLLLASRRFPRNRYLPYGQYLALAGIAMLIWGVQIFQWYTN